MAQSPPHQPPYNPSPLHFQIPHFVLGGTPNVAPGGGAEVLPCMFGQGAQAWSDYDKNWYENAAPSRYYSLNDLVGESPSASTSSRPFEFIDDHQRGRSPSPSPVIPPTDMENEQVFIVPPPAPPTQLAHPQHMYLAPYAPHPPPPISIPSFTFPSLSSLDPTAPLPPIPSNGLPLYSASGFDMLKMLGKVATRPNPRIMLGPVDMTCSFVVADVRRFDSPIVYASPTFSRLTGYSESEVLGRNCRFLQSPLGQVARGEERRFTSPDAVHHLQKFLLQEKECQASLINYRRDGRAFINLVTVIPIAVDDLSDEITHCVGFQVDLAEQPNAILQRLRDGSYIVNYSNSESMSGLGGMFGGEVRRTRGVSQEMLDILRSSQPWGQGTEAGAKPVRDHERAALHSMLLENTDDFIHVVSLKGALLYVAPAIHRVLGYNATELIGKSIADICHPADVVPLMRELKEASSHPPPSSSPPPPPSHAPHPAAPLFALLPSQPSHTPPPPKPIHLLFRARHKTAAAGFVWLEARGRLHIEAGKGRKAIILIGRRTGVPHLRWRDALAGGGCGGWWGLVAPNGLVLAAGEGSIWVGRSLASLVRPEDARRVGDVLAGAACADRDEVRRVRCGMLGLGSAEPAEILFYACAYERGPGSPPLPPRLVFQVRPVARTVHEPAATMTTMGRAPDADVLEELDTTRATSWQYELTRLRFENKRMQDEVAAFERERHGRGAVLPLRHPHPHPHPRRRNASPVTSSLSTLKRTRSGDLKLPFSFPPSATESGADLTSPP